MRHLALDVGDERIGVAISDQSGYLSRPLEVIPRRAGAASYARLQEIIAQHKVEMIVVGLPLLPDGREGQQARSVRAYVEGLRAHVAVPIVYWDERHSTQRAAEALRENRASRKRRQGAVDAVAAAVILQEYLDAQGGGLPR